MKNSHSTRQSLLYALFFILICSSCSKDEQTNIITKDKLPQVTQDFIAKYFPGKEYTEVSKLTPSSEGDVTYYTVFLSDKSIETHFDQSGNWLYLSDPAGLNSSLLDLLPAGIKAYLDKNHSGYFLTELQNKPYTYEIDLNSIRSLAFDKSGGYMGVDLDDYGNNIPSSVSDFISSNFGDIGKTVIKKEEDDYSKRSYIIYLSNGYNLNFASTGRWMLIDAKTENIAESYLQLLPQEVLNGYNQSVGKSAKLVGIAFPDEEYYQMIYLDSSNQRKIYDHKMKGYMPLFTVNESLDYIQQFIEEHCSTECLETPSWNVYDDPLFFEVTLTTSVFLLFDQRKSIYEIDTKEFKPITDEVVDMFSPNILTYISSNCQEKRVSQVKRVDAGFEVKLYGNQKMQFNQQGEYVKEL